jgi:hypothetical protein
MNSDRDAWERKIAERTRSVADVTLPPRPQKFGARPMTVDGVRFDSTREATRYQELKLMAAAGLIAHLELQPIFPLQVVELFRGGPPWTVTLCGVYTADFRYVDNATGEIIVEDTKSEPTKTTAYQLRKRIAEAVHGFTVREV